MQDSATLRSLAANLRRLALLARDREAADLCEMAARYEAEAHLRERSEPLQPLVRE